MSVLIVGASHHSAPVELLERLAVTPHDATKVALAALETNFVQEAVVVTTCNRIEIYAEVDRFHGSVEDLSSILVERSGLAAADVLPSLYVHYDDAAVSHLLNVVTGLDSMVVGESQILGQAKEALRRGQDDQTVGQSLNSLFQHGLRVGKRAHAETNIDAAGQSIVSVALSQVSALVPSWDDARVCIVGAGSVAALAAASVRRRGNASITVVSRTAANAEHLARSVDGHGADMAALRSSLADADVLICCTGSTGVVVSTDDVRAAIAERRPDAQFAIIDLALPHDVDLGAAEIPGVLLVALQTVADAVQSESSRADVEVVRTIARDEVAAYLAAREATRVAPTVVALRSMATGVVAAELERLFSRVTELSPEQRAEVTRAVNRVADKLLHEPTVRIKELGGRIPASTYADALAELFSLDAGTVEALIRPGDAGAQS